jgi:hypothetical protein
MDRAMRLRDPRRKGHPDDDGEKLDIHVLPPRVARWPARLVAFER